MKVQDFFNENPVFRHEAFVVFLESTGSHRTKTREALLAYHVKEGHLLRLRRGLYAVVPRGLYVPLVTRGYLPLFRSRTKITSS